MSTWSYINFSHIIILLQNSRWEDTENGSRYRDFEVLEIHMHILVYI